MMSINDMFWFVGSFFSAFSLFLISDLVRTVPYIIKKILKKVIHTPDSDKIDDVSYYRF